MAKLDDIKKELFVVVQKEVAQNEIDQAESLAALETRRAEMASSIQELNAMENGYLHLQETAVKLQRMIKEIEETLFDPYAFTVLRAEDTTAVVTSEIRK